jgi:hypothetical protein
MRRTESSWSKLKAWPEAVIRRMRFWLLREQASLKVLQIAPKVLQIVGKVLQMIFKVIQIALKVLQMPSGRYKKSGWHR